MRAGELSPVVPRLKREDYRQTKHDAVFSKWQVLIGSNDWEDFSKGKEGVARYRVHNLPTNSSPGLYELGVTVIQTDSSRIRSGRDVEKLDPGGILVVYIGQADSVRTRLQRYGRSGAHLGNVNLVSIVTTDLSDCETGSPEKKAAAASLFEEVFSRGGSVVYRWAPMTSKRNAEETEAQLLNTFDYAWNRGSNGDRRIDEILIKLSKGTLATGKHLSISKLLLPFTQKQVGIKIKGDKHVLIEEKKSSKDAPGDNNNLLSAIFKMSRSRPKLVSDKSEGNSDSGPVCGVILKDGTSCTNTPVQGRKRCKEHKGRRIYGFAFKPSTKECPNANGDQDSSTTCGLISTKGELCERQPVSGRKRCEEHKGMRVNALLSKFSPKDKPPNAETVDAPDKHEMPKEGATTPANAESVDAPDKHEMPKEGATTLCAATTRNGSLCSRKPMNGSRRCWQHGGKTCDDGSSTPDKAVNYAICGVNLADGLVCERAPVRGRKRCEQHKGMRVTIS